MRHQGQRGEGQLGCIFGLIVLLAGGFFAYKLIPVKVKAADLRQTITDSARSAGRLKDPQITKEILDKAEELELPVTKENIKIRRRANEIDVEVTYTVPIEFPGYTFNWNFHHTADNPIF